MALLDLLPGIKSAVVGPIRTVILQLRTAVDTLTHVFETGKEIIDDTVGIYHELQHFDLNPKWQIRVLSAPDAIQNVKDLTEAPGKIFLAAGSVEGFLLRVFPRLARAIGKAIAKILAIVGLVAEGLIDVSNALADIKTFVGQFRVALESLNRLDAVFLRQNKKRETVRLEDGSTMRIRVPRRTRHE